MSTLSARPLKVSAKACGARNCDKNNAKRKLASAFLKSIDLQENFNISKGQNPKIPAKIV
jgi:hypothetical protein